jgi:hypothetical protein
MASQRFPSISDDDDSDFDEFDDDPVLQALQDKRRAEMMKTITAIKKFDDMSSRDKEKYTQQIYDFVDDYLQRDDIIPSILIGGRAFMRYIDLSKVNMQNKILLYSLDYDIVVKRDKDMIPFTQDISDHIKKQAEEHKMPIPEIQANMLETFNVLQIGFNIGNTTTWIVDIHSEEHSFKDEEIPHTIVDGIVCAKLKWLEEQFL